MRNDFHDKMSSYEVQKDCFDQDCYKKRMQNEADLMIALEALKESVRGLESDMKYI